MTVELTIPDAGESVQEVQIVRWLKQEGDHVDEDEDLVELETDKASLELPAPASGTLGQILKNEGDAVRVGETIGTIEESDGRDDKKDDSDEQEPAATQKDVAKSAPEGQPEEDEQREERAEDNKTTQAGSESDENADQKTSGREGRASASSVPATPAARRLLRKYGLTSDEVPTNDHRLQPDDVRRYVKEQGLDEPDRDVDQAEPEAGAPEDGRKPPGARPTTDTSTETSPIEETVPMSLIRRRIAERLVEAQQNAALLTTFNEIDMSRVVQMRKEFGGPFQEKYGVKLGFMSFFVKAVVDALKQFPDLNAEVRGTDVVYRNTYNVGIAIGSGKGLVVPVLRHAERMSFAEIERTIEDFAARAQQSKLKPDELDGGTFTISNGGVYGSLLSTPIVNPPQSGVLGMHAIQDRPVAGDGDVVVRPMMYVALTYDHRIIDGREAVSFLRRIKEAIEQPPRMLIEV